MVTNPLLNESSSNDENVDIAFLAILIDDNFISMLKIYWNLVAMKKEQVKQDTLISMFANQLGPA